MVRTTRRWRSRRRTNTGVIASFLNTTFYTKLLWLAILTHMAALSMRAAATHSISC